MRMRLQIEESKPYELTFCCIYNEYLFLVFKKNEVFQISIPILVLSLISFLLMICTFSNLEMKKMVEFVSQ